MRNLWMDAVATLRGMAARPAFTAVAIGALGLGIGLDTAIFSLVHRALLESLPYEEPERLVRVWESRPQMGPEAAEIAAFSMDHFRAWREASEVFSGMAAYQDQSFNLTGGDEPARIVGQRVSAALFPMLGVRPALGRVFTEDEETPGRDRVAVLSHALWQGRFGGDEDVLGRTLRLDGEPVAVVGVMPAGFAFPSPAVDLWVPLARTTPPPTRPGEMRIELVPVIAKLKPGVTIEEAEASGRSFLEHLRGEGSRPRELEEGVTIHLTSLHEQLVGPVRPALLVLAGAVSLVLLIVCANVANLFLARAQSREPELAVRTALGAGRARLARQLLTESLLHALFGGVLGVGLAHAGLRILPRLQTGAPLLIEDARLHGPVLAFALGISVLTALLVGLLPALRASRADVVSGLSARAGSRAPTHRSRNLLAISEVALAVSLFVAAALLVRSFLELARTNPGYEPENVLTFRIALPRASYESASSRNAFYDALRERLAGLEGVSAAGLVNLLPLEDARMVTLLAVEGRPPVTDRSRMPRASVRIVSPGFFEAMGVPLLAGRGFEERDAGAPPVVVVNEALARRVFPDEEALGQRLRRMGEIVGIVGDVRQQGLDAPPEPELYLDYRQLPPAMGAEISEMGVVIRHRSETEPLLAAVEASVRGLDRELPLDDVRTMEERLAASVARPRLYALLLSLFAAVALVLAATGVASVVSYQASERTREHGLRMALGATSSDILRLAMSDGLAILAAGLAIGLVASFFVGRALESVLHGVEPIDPIAIGLAAFVLGVTVALSISIPARRAARMDPMTALRYE